MAVFTRYSFRVCVAQKRQTSSLVSLVTAVDDTHGRLRAGTLQATAVDDILRQSRSEALLPQQWMIPLAGSEMEHFSHGGG